MFKKEKNVANKVSKMRSEKGIFLYVLRLCAQRCPRVGPRTLPGTLKRSNLVPKGAKRTHILSKKMSKGIKLGPNLVPKGT